MLHCGRQIWVNWGPNNRYLHATDWTLHRDVTMTHVHPLPSVAMNRIISLLSIYLLLIPCHCFNSRLMPFAWPQSSVNPSKASSTRSDPLTGNSKLPNRDMHKLFSEFERTEPDPNRSTVPWLYCCWQLVCRYWSCLNLLWKVIAVDVEHLRMFNVRLQYTQPLITIVHSLRWSK